MHHKKENIETACVSYTETPLSIPPYDSLTIYCHSLFNLTFFKQHFSHQMFVVFPSKEKQHLGFWY